jgi:hypothetical protein
MQIYKPIQIRKGVFWKLGMQFYISCTRIWCGSIENEASKEQTQKRCVVG